MPRVRHQLAIQVSPQLLEQVRAAAVAQGRTTTSVVVEWIEAGLAAAAPPAAGADPGLLRRIEALERAVEALQRRPPAGGTPAPRTGDTPAPAVSPDRVKAQVNAGGQADGITTAQLADRLGVKRGTLNARIGRLGGACDGLVLEGWRCVGTVASGRGGPPRALWQPIDAA